MHTKQVSDTRTWEELGFVKIPRGEFIMGNEEENLLAYHDEIPRHTFDISLDYWVGRFPIINAVFADFVSSTSFETRAEREGWGWVWGLEKEEWGKREGANWKHPLGANSSIEGREDHPVVQVCWYDAIAYCEWLNQMHKNELPKGYQFRLPSEAEWEKAARGPNGREWPWGNEFDPGLCNSAETGKIGTIAVGAHSPRADSVYGVADMSGNIWEWTTTLWGSEKEIPTFEYPYKGEDGRENLDAGEGYYRVIRGGSYKNDMRAVRCACRDIDPPAYSMSNLGFRVFVVLR